MSEAEEILKPEGMKPPSYSTCECHGVENCPSQHTGTRVMLADDSTGQQWPAIVNQAKLAFQSGLLPGYIKKPEQAAIIALKGRELRLPIMTSLAEIFVVDGKAMLSATLMLSLIYRDVPGARVTVTTPPDSQHLECEAVFERPGGNPQTFRFTIEDARRADLLGKMNWKRYPQDMLRARCISRGAKAVFPDAIVGCAHQDETFEEVTSDTQENKAGVLAARLARRNAPSLPEEDRFPFEKEIPAPPSA